MIEFDFPFEIKLLYTLQSNESNNLLQNYFILMCFVLVSKFLIPFYCFFRQRIGICYVIKCFFITVTYRISSWLGIGIRFRHSNSERMASKNYAYLHKIRNYAVKSCHDILEQFCKIGVCIFYVAKFLNFSLDTISCIF